MAAEVDRGLGGNVFGEVNIGAQALVLAEVVCGLGMNKVRQIDFIFAISLFFANHFILICSLPCLEKLEFCQQAMWLNFFDLLGLQPSQVKSNMFLKLTNTFLITNI